MYLFANFSDFGSILGGPGGSENCKKTIKIDFGTRSERVWTCNTILVAVFVQFLQILIDFGRILKVCLEDFGK